MSKKLKAVIQKKIGQVTVVALLERLFVHPRYGKRIRRSKKVYAHNILQAEEKDIVLLEQMRPTSRLKRWKVIKVFKPFEKR